MTNYLKKLAYLNRELVKIAADSIASYANRSGELDLGQMDIPQTYNIRGSQIDADTMRQNLQRRNEEKLKYMAQVRGEDPAKTRKYMTRKGYLYNTENLDEAYAKRGIGFNAAATGDNRHYYVRVQGKIYDVATPEGMADARAAYAQRIKAKAQRRAATLNAVGREKSLQREEAARRIEAAKRIKAKAQRRAAILNAVGREKSLQREEAARRIEEENRSNRLMMPRNTITSYPLGPGEVELNPNSWGDAQIISGYPGYYSTTPGEVELNPNSWGDAQIISGYPGYYSTTPEYSRGLPSIEMPWTSESDELVKNQPPGTLPPQAEVPLEPIPQGTGEIRIPTFSEMFPQTDTDIWSNPLQ